MLYYSYSCHDPDTDSHPDQKSDSDPYKASIGPSPQSWGVGGGGARVELGGIHRVPVPAPVCEEAASA